MRLFGFEIIRAEEKDKDQSLSFAEPINDDGALTIGTALGGAYGMYLDIEGSAKTEAQLVTTYRQMTLNPEIQQAVDEIVNEAISVNTHEKVVEIVLDETKLPARLKDKITEEFENILTLLDFSNNGYDIFSKFYVDGRLNYHVIIDTKQPKRGILELRYLDPRKIRLIREMNNKEKQVQGMNANFKRIKNEYYMYSDNGFGAQTASNYSNSITGLRISKDSVVRVTSGILSENNSVVYSYLHRAIKSLNQLRMLEDATVIYTMTRAPERRVFYVDVGNLPKAKAEQYLHDMMARHKNKVIYDPTSGEIRDDRKMMTMTEDYWFPRREGNRSTEVTTLQGGASLLTNDNIMYFQNKLYNALNVPIGRLRPESMYSLGRASEITREELKFSKFVRRIRTKFSNLFDKCLERQLILKGIITPDEWKEIQNYIKYDFMQDSYFEELKEAEILNEKITTLRNIEDLIGKYYSRQWVLKNVLHMNDDDTRTMLRQIDAERAIGIYGMEVGPDGQPVEGGKELGLIDLLDQEDAAQAAEREKPAPETAQQRNERIR
jgi:hypothetical protein